MKALILAVILCCSLTAPLLAQADTLRVVTLYSPPLVFETGDQVTGLAADVVREGLRRMGHEATITIMPWKRAVFMTRFGEADAIFYAVRNEERELWFHYPDEHLVEETTVMLKRNGRQGATSRTMDYGQIKLGIGRGFYYGPKVKEFLENTKFKAIEETTSMDFSFAKLIEGRIDAFLAEYYLATYFMKKNAARNLVEVVTNEDGTPMVFDSVASYLAFSRETMSREMAEEFSIVLKTMKADGTYDKIAAQYR